MTRSLLESFQILHAYTVLPQEFHNLEVIHKSELYHQVAETFEIDNVDFLELVLGKQRYKEQKPYAMAYAGHQFGQWAGQLGDGRAINLFEEYHYGETCCFQLKGAGPTPYSRRGDGYAVLRSSLREHLCSEAMHHLGVRTTRSLLVALTGEQVLRDKLYDGNAAYEKGAVVNRSAQSFLRFGNFELLAAQGDEIGMRALADFLIDRYYPATKRATSRESIAQLFESIAVDTLETVINWQRVGFVHGVMNTDNMSLIGLTIDYGPYGFLEEFDFDWTPNTSDRDSRYAYGKQPEIALWNLWKLASAICPIVGDSKPLEATLNKFKTNYESQYLQMMASKIGLDTTRIDQVFLNELTTALSELGLDFTIFFRELCKISHQTSLDQDYNFLSISFYDTLDQAGFKSTLLYKWLVEYKALIAIELEDFTNDYGLVSGEGNEVDSAFAKARSKKMNLVNPKFVLRNYMAQLAIEAAEKQDYTVLDEMYRVLQRPYEEQPAASKWYSIRPQWATESDSCTRLSCSS